MIEAYLEGIILELATSPAVTSFHVIRQEATERDGYIRIKCRLSNRDTLEFAEYIEVHETKIRNVTYSYHWQDAKGRLVKRWDNVGHHKEVHSFPHHLHLPAGKAIATVPMTLKKVFVNIEKVIPVKREEG